MGDWSLTQVRRGKKGGRNRVRVRNGFKLRGQGKGKGGLVERLV